jgi:hypothetical protein
VLRDRENLEPGQVLQTKSTSPVRAIDFTDRLATPTLPSVPSLSFVPSRSRVACVREIEEAAASLARLQVA